MALYLKYRPQSLDELIGQDTVKKNLLSAYVSGKLSHAYLLTGPRGTGKTSTARILAKMVNCEDKNAPCNKCATCLSITDGSNLDLIEIDAASNRGIDDIRALRENIKLSPSGARKKVYIIDEVHMLTTEAFNALLKTLEEPPAHVLFILATTDSSKIPQTILSRTQRLDFKLATQTEIVEALGKIVLSEKIDIEKEALNLIAKKADGSFRDAVKFLDQVSSYSGKITAKDVGENLQTVEFSLVYELLENLANKKAAEALLLISNNLKGKEVKGWILGSLDSLRAVMLIKNDLGEVLVKDELDEEKYQILLKLAYKFSMEDLIKSLNFLQDAYEKLKFTSIPTLALELAVVEICSLSPVILNVSEGSQDSKSLDFSAAPQNDKIEIANDENKIQTSKSDDVVSQEVSILQEKWNFVLETIKPYNFSLEALLRLVKILDCRDGSVVLEVPYSFHQRILEAPKSRDLLESVLSEILGKAIRVSCVLGNKPLRVEDIANVELAADDEVVRAAAEIFGSDTVN